MPIVGSYRLIFSEFYAILIGQVIMGNIILTNHAIEQINSRNICTPDEVLLAVNRHSKEIEKSKAWQVKVIVKSLPRFIYLPDGSNGDIVIAAIDPGRLTIKTVMLERRSQINRHSRNEPYLR